MVLGKRMTSPRHYHIVKGLKDHFITWRHLCSEIQRDYSHNEIVRDEIIRVTNFSRVLSFEFPFQPNPKTRKESGTFLRPILS